MIQALRIAINGYGRIGRCFLRALHEAGLEHDFQIVLINEPSDLDSMVYLTRFDSTHGVFPGTVQAGVDSLLVNQRPIAVTHEKTPRLLIGPPMALIWWLNALANMAPDTS
ncbi:glyceraldehyde 3-phosphate dehydrogenase NAD-binding domain-containing protein [Neopusillimonas aromaticivorans]|uniref:glyceraldehyde 3-phosphate dehydrogenase NAD-binding domain-containing protein n=1 Tax=Neopusillimonas aromaticivorans TaxID=2979868 RepID=UPI0025985E2B|nr:glyceraldehyde 3-phosphate dehydrogenase NAD-binding domain-containing protein [Neopusillimonas aromaticivorans]WJJ93653.1 glyceraldehyde 3-phosphate dehydrogenase N-terminal domain-containing protein [Neopusillimonas aromaticivorans]